MSPTERRPSVLTIRGTADATDAVLTFFDNAERPA